MQYLVHTVRYRPQPDLTYHYQRQADELHERWLCVLYDQHGGLDMCHYTRMPRTVLVSGDKPHRFQPAISTAHARNIKVFVQNAVARGCTQDAQRVRTNRSGHTVASHTKADGIARLNERCHAEQRLFVHHCKHRTRRGAQCSSGWKHGLLP